MKEHQQVGIISYDGTYEHLLLAVKIQGEDGQKGKGVWIFPVPSSPEDIKLDIVKDFSTPSMAIELHDTLEMRFYQTASIFAGTQIYPLAFLPPLLMRGRGGKTYKNMERITVHEVVEKMGLTSELITAKDEVKFEEYLREKGLNFPDNAREIIGTYIGKHYSFVVTWISDISMFYKVQRVRDLEELKYGEIKKPISIYLTFKTPKVYYPLRLTSVYGYEVIPIRLYIMGFVTPEKGNLPFNINPDYYYLKNYSPMKDYVSFYGGKDNIKNLVYSKIIVDKEASKYTDDLWFHNKAPLKITVIYWLIKWFIPIAVIYYLILSCISSLLAGMIAFNKRIAPPKKVLFVIGLLNCLTLVGFILLTYRIISKYVPNVDEKIKEMVENAGYAIYYYNIQRKFYVWFVLIFLFLSLVSIHILKLLLTNYSLYTS